MNKKNGFVAFLLIFGIGQIFAASCGDVNSSGKIDIVDALMTAQYYVGLNPPNFTPAAAEVSGDGAVTIVDALQIAQYYIGIINWFPKCIMPPSGTYELQAETQATWNDAAVESDYAGYTGSGYVNTADAAGSWIEWAIVASDDCIASCVFTYAAESGQWPMDLSINRKVAISLSFPASGAWTSWSTQSMPKTTILNLLPGLNAIRLTATSSAGAPNIDKMDLMTLYGIIYTPAPTPTPTPAPGGGLPPGQG